jgi:tRNA threonylcarbamoyladenosine biosynthesis protein TsaB
LFERVLIIETSGKVGQAAVASGERLLAMRSLPEARRHARDLAARSAELLAEQGWRARDLTAVVVNIGPGSFTGLRVGLASAKALAYGTGCTLFGVPAFDAVAVRIPQHSGKLEVIADALQGQVYCQRFAWMEGEWQPDAPVRIRPFADWLTEAGPGSWLAGPAVEPYRAKIREGLTILDPALSEPDGASLLQAARAAAERYRVSAWEIEPIYLRGSSAEEKRKHGT